MSIDSPIAYDYMYVAVGSLNPVKIEAVRLAFLALWPNEAWRVEGVSVVSGVRDQPMSDEESIQGARNRATLAREKLDADYGIGLEGGIHEIGDLAFDCGWVAVRDRKGREGVGSTAKIPTPPRMMKMIKSGMELGVVNDLIFGTINSKQGDGHFGLMTKNVITRTSGYRDGVVMALSRFVHPDLFEDDKQ